MTSRPAPREGKSQPRARRGEARPFPIKGGRWALNLHLAPSGDRTWPSRLYGRSADEVETKRDTILKEYELLTAAPGAGTKLETVLQRFLNAKEAHDDVSERSVRVSTWIGYETHVRLHIVPYLGERPIGAITGPEVKEWLRQLGRDGRSTAMRTKVFWSLRTALNWAVSEGYLKESPIPEKMKIKQAPRKAIPPLSLEVLGKMILAVKGHYLESLYVTAMTMGPRLGELIGLSIGDASRERHTITIQVTGSWAGNAWHFEDTKREASRRVVYLPESVWTLVDAQIAKRLAAGAAADDLLWVRETGNPLRGDGSGGVGDLFKRRLKKAGLPPRNFHQLRAMAASLLLSLNGGDYAEVAQILGHSTYRTTLDIYSRLLPEVGRRTAADVDALYRRLVSLDPSFDKQKAPRARRSPDKQARAQARAQIRRRYRRSLRRPHEDGGSDAQGYGGVAA